jgi:branched-chain amino acid transport system substrate-binding protein
VRSRKLIAATVSVVLAGVLAACSSSSSSSGGNAGGSQKPTGGTIKIGVLTELSGPAASGFTTTKRGVEAYIDYINSSGGVDGKKIELVYGDTTGTPTGALTAAQKLVQNSKVYAIMENSSVSYGAERYLLKAGIPMVGSAIDGPIWGDSANTNLFAAPGYARGDEVQLATGQFIKSVGGTKCASLGYSDSQSAQQSAKAFIASCEAAGLKNAYLNVQVPSSTTDVGAIALAIKKSGADALSASLRPNTAFALIAALKQVGANIKVPYLLTGYGSDLLASAPSVQVSQGVYFSPLGYPAEVVNPATTLRKQLLAKLGAASPPTFGDQYGYLIAVAMVDILKAAGANATQADFITKGKAIKTFNGEGLLPYDVDFGQNLATPACVTAVKLTGNAFVPVNGGKPFCAGTAKLGKV